MSSRLDILGVQAFVAIAELGSFRAAANHLHLSESALGRRLKKLEEGLGLRLLSRTTRVVALSPEGADFLPKARQVVQELAAALDALRTGDARPTGTVKLGCLPTVAALWSPVLLRTYALDFPQVRVQLFDRSATEIRKAVLDGEVDFAITAAGAPHQKIESENLFTEPMVAVCPAAHLPARRRSIRWADLADEPLISIGVLSANRALIEEFVRRHNFSLSWTYQVEHLATAVSLVAGGGGIAILPATAVAGRHEKGGFRVLSLRQPALHRQIVLLRRKLPMSAPAQALFELARRTLRGWRFGTVVDAQR